MKKSIVIALLIVLSALTVFTGCALKMSQAHMLDKVEAVPATADEDGTDRYWKCRDCGKLFSDKEGKVETDLNALKIAKGMVALSGGIVNVSVSGSAVFTEDKLPVMIDAILISDHEVTQSEYETYCAYSGTAPGESYGVGPDHPAYNASWYDAIIYCNLRSIAEGLDPAYLIEGETDVTKWPGVVELSGKYHGPVDDDETWNNVIWNKNANGYRLPTEAEWEYAARGGDPSAEAWGYAYAGADYTSDLKDYAVYAYNSSYKTAEVRSRKANGAGLFDMTGNVWEWCWDQEEYEGEVNRANRGGSYSHNPELCMVDSVFYYYPYTNTENNVGFRIVRTRGV